MPIPGRTTSWATLVVLVLLTGAAAAGSLTTAPRRSSTTRRPVSAAGTLNLARRGLNQSFVATYRLTEGPGRTGSDNVLAAVVVAQRGPLANVAGEEWLQPGPGEWSYLVEWPTGEETEMVKRGDGLYSCDRSPGRSWECDGPDRYGGGNGVLIAVSAYEPVTQYGALQETLRGSPPHTTSSIGPAPSPVDVCPASRPGAPLRRGATPRGGCLRRFPSLGARDRWLVLPALSSSRARLCRAASSSCPSDQVRGADRCDGNGDRATPVEFAYASHEEAPRRTGSSAAR